LSDEVGVLVDDAPQCRVRVWAGVGRDVGLGLGNRVGIGARVRKQLWLGIRARVIKE